MDVNLKFEMIAERCPKGRVCCLHPASLHVLAKKKPTKITSKLMINEARNTSLRTYEMKPLKPCN